MKALAPLAAIFGLAGITLSEEERAFFKRVRPVGYILFNRNINNPQQVIALTSELRSLCPGDNPLVLIDQEGGRVQRLIPPYWRYSPSMGEFGALYARNPGTGAKILKMNMSLIGRELCALGVDVNCAPVMDVPVSGSHDIIGDRAFSSDPAMVAAMASHACSGLREAGVMPVFKHMPGHGRAMSDSHKELPVVSDRLEVLERSDFAPFKALCSEKDQRLSFGMTAHVLYKFIDPKHPATTSKIVISNIIRGEINFQGLLISDDLGMKALSGPFDERALASLEAGCDVVLHCDGNLKDMEAVARGAKTIGPRAIEAITESNSVRLRPQKAFEDPLVSEFKILDTLRRG
ncbi:MAG: beta-N-acetylhexosaminidase [Candidatus Marinimicrobia bacterium]|nr:beta-N-acetylhexosaminidase [Candidatus Neomarinimicrobiota bacterium]